MSRRINVARGQYLDDPHHSDDQGRFGVTLGGASSAYPPSRDATFQGRANPRSSKRIRSTAWPLIEQWPVDDGDRAQSEMFKADDFALPTMKLAYMVDAQKPDLSMVGEADQPQLVDLLLGTYPPRRQRMDHQTRRFEPP